MVQWYIVLSRLGNMSRLGHNTIYTNETSIVTNVDINKTAISDHSRVEITTNLTIMEEQTKHKTKDEDNKMKSLNFRAEEKINWKWIKEYIGRIKWKEMLKKGDSIEITEEFLNKISKLSLENIPKKKKEGKDRKIPKEIKKLLNRIKMLKRDKHKAQSKEKKKVIENKIVETEVELLERKRKKKYESEKKAIECMKDNPKMFYSLINKQNNRKNEVCPFKEEEEIINDGEEICNRLVSEYYS